jgi:hypothetical protein
MHMPPESIEQRLDALATHRFRARFHLHDRERALVVLARQDDDVVAAYDAMAFDGISTLSEQGERLADWAIDRTRAILDLKPGRLRTSRPARGQGR